MTDGCFPGISSRMSRSVIAKEIEVDGGTYIDNVRRDLNYFVVGNNTNFLLGVFMLRTEGGVDDGLPEEGESDCEWE